MRFDPRQTASFAVAAVSIAIAALTATTLTA